MRPQIYNLGRFPRYYNFWRSRETIVWVDKKNDKYCGSAGEFLRNDISDTESLAYEESYDYYLHTKDIYFYVINSIMTDFNDMVNNFSNNDSFFIDDSLYPRDQQFFYVVRRYDKDKHDALIEELDFENKRDFFNTRRILDLHTRPISILNEHPRWPKDIKLPEVSLELPTNAEELDLYKRWISTFSLRFRDDYGTEIKYEILDGIGLKAISAGPDKIFGTEDDIEYLREYPKQAE